MNKFLLLLLALVVLPSSLQSQYWLQKSGGATIDESIDIAVDPSNNAYSVGYFTGLSVFGGNYLNSSGVTDIFVAKINNQGNYVWAKQAGGTGADRAEAVVTDATGNVYVTGYFSGTATFGSISLTSSGVRDVFVAKYNSFGLIVWAVKAGGTGADLGFGIDVNNVGEVFVTGSFKNTATFGSVSLTSNNSTSDIFITKLNSSGVFQWAKSGTSTLTNSGRSLGSDNYGNVYVTGQFSDTLTFDQVHNNQSQNIIFLVKLDSLGNEVWFTKLGGAISNIANDLAVDTVGNCYITGDFDGVLNVYNINTGVSSTISSTYPNTIFTARYDSSGLWNLKGAIGSNNAISAQSIANDNAGNYYVGGDFECDLTEFSVTYGTANFLSIGSKDVFVAKFSNTGTMNYARNIGGPDDDLCLGVAVNNTGKIYASGSFSTKINIPVSTSFNSTNLTYWQNSSCNGNAGFCSDPNYGNYRTMISQGNKDAFMVNAFDPNRSPYDFVERTGTGCVKDLPLICIENCMDSVVACTDTTLHVSYELCDNIGPEISYSWSNGSPDDTALINTTGWVFVTVSHTDGCFSFVDSIYVEISPIPSKPHVTDGKGFNIDAYVLGPVQLCMPDTTLLTGGGFSPTDTYWWEGPGLGTGVYDSSAVASVEGTYTFHVMNANGCINVNAVFVKENLPLPPFDLEIYSEDSIEVCLPDPVEIQLYDSVSNPSVSPLCLATNIFTVFSWWNTSPYVPYQTNCHTYIGIKPDTTGFYTVYDTTTRFNYCYADTFYAQKTIHVTVKPKPIITPFPLTLTGETVVCPGDSITLTATGGPNYTWFGNGIWGSQDSVVKVWQAGTYSVQSTKVDTNSYGCSASLTMSDQIIVTMKGQPVATASPQVICPGSTVNINSNMPAGNAWEGPNGPIAGGQMITVSTPGQYFTVVNDVDSCALVSNTVNIQQYTTPTLVPYGDTAICPGSVTVIGVQASAGSVVTWDPPLIGSNPTQTIGSPGTYSCSVLSCGITTAVSITIHLGNSLAEINPVGVLCADSSIVLEGPPGMASYNWLPNNETTQNITVDTIGTYTLSIVDPLGCSGTSAPFVLNEVTVNANLLNSNLGFCYGDSINLQADTGLASYLWSPGGQTTSNITVSQPGNYSFLVTDSNGCSQNSDPFFVSESDSVATVLLVGDSIICNRDTAWLNPVVTGYSSYVWMPGSISSVNLPVTQTGVYALIATDSAGCIVGSDSFSIHVLNSPLSTVSSNGVLCKDSSLVLNGAAGLTNYIWMPGGQTTSNITVTSPGTYSLIVTDTNGCESEPSSYVVNEIIVPVEITNSSLGFCEGDSILLQANAGMSEYLWLPSGDTSSVLVQTESGQVTLQVVDSNGCRASIGPVEVTESSSQAEIIHIPETVICEGDTFYLFADPNFESYQWKPSNQDTATLLVTQSGWYWFTAVDSMGCVSVSDSVEIEVIDNDLVVPSVSVDSVVCLGANARFIADAGTGLVYWYEDDSTTFIQEGDTLNVPVYEFTTFYVQTVSEPCLSEKYPVSVSVDDCNELNISNIFTPNGDGENDGWNLEILGATCYEVNIYNRWGLLIYSLHQNGQIWDGTIEGNGLDAADGTYFYILNYCDFMEKKFSQTGTITLMR